jgi:hypothetical protein
VAYSLCLSNYYLICGLIEMDIYFKQLMHNVRLLNGNVSKRIKEKERLTRAYLNDDKETLSKAYKRYGVLTWKN